jgi:predicted PhzF superfamily epimerase YddE/YHI9
VAALRVLRVFVGEGGGGGNPLGVFLDGRQIPASKRQRVAAELAFSETAFVDDLERGELRIFTPAAEIPFAGHPLVGTAWLLRRERSGVRKLHPPAGEVRVRYDEERTWIAGRPEWVQPFEYLELASPAEIDALAGPPTGSEMAYCWAWEDESEGRVRARSFVPGLGIAEDEATGSAALALSARLGRALEIRQGWGSRLSARPLEDGFAEVGGITEPVEVRELTP